MLTSAQAQKIEEVLKKTLRAKLANYRPETSNMPFHTRLLGKDRLALYSFIHSLNTVFGSAIFEPVACALAEPRFRRVQTQATAGAWISSEAQLAIQEIMDGLATGRCEPNLEQEIERLRLVAQKGARVRVKLVKIDVLAETHSNKLYLFDLKTVKPNLSSFKDYKRTLLEWTATFLAGDPELKITAAIAMPYNPYEPKPYERWTLKGMLDLKHQLRVGKEFWDFLGGEGAYEEVLNLFEKVGIELRPEIDSGFKRFA